MRQVETLPDENPALMLIARLATGEMVTYYNETLPAELIGKLAECVPTIQFPRIAPLLDILNSYNIKPEMDHYRTYLFPTQFAYAPDMDVGSYSSDHPKVKAFQFDHFAERVYAIERDDHIASACASAREDRHCGEAWVYTDLAYRNQGLAQRVVGVWARNLIRAAKTPLYSHKIDNLASAALASRLGLRPVFEEISISSST
jgi:RimJ/RimL family protein N-acetyltransferase